jgi:hypothetical protein
MAARTAPYRRLLGRIDGLRIWRVDGHQVRDGLDVEFTNGHHHFTRRYVPLDEIWLDREPPGSGEWRFWARHQIVERAEMAAGASYPIALARANRAERAERDAAARPARVRRRRLGAVDRRDVWLVDGCAVRTCFHLDFTLGGHGYRYRFIPRREIWIDDAVAAAERPAILHHEAVEVELMARGMHYADAHVRASYEEGCFRAGRVECRLTP